MFKQNEAVKPARSTAAPDPTLGPAILMQPANAGPEVHTAVQYRPRLPCIALGSCPSHFTVGILANTCLFLQPLVHNLTRYNPLQGNTANYYDPANSLLPCVFKTGLGIPISLAVIYVAVGRRAGLPLDCVGELPLKVLMS